MSAHTSSTSPRSATPVRSTQPLHHRDILRVLFALLAAVFTALLSGTVAFPALPTITSELGGGTAGLTWIITISLLANATSTPIWGTLADLRNPKALIELALLILAGGSVVAASAPTLGVLFVGRALQGVGMGGVVTITVAVLGAIIPPREQGRYSGYVGVVIAVSMAGSPLLGGMLVDSPLGWRACFLVCAPPAALAVLALRHAPQPVAGQRSKVRIDWLGAALLTTGVTLLLVCVTLTGRGGQSWVSWTSIGYLVVGASLVAAALVVERRAQTPVLPLDLLGERTVVCTIAASVSAGLGFYATQSFLAAFFQSVRDQSATAAGVLLTPMVVGLALSSIVSGRLITRFGRWKVFLVAGALLQLVGCGALASVDTTSALWLIELAVLLCGLGIGMLLQNLVLAVQNTVDPVRIGAAGGAVLYFRSIGAAVGLPVLAAALPAHSEGTGRVFLALAALALVSLGAVALIPNLPLRTNLEPGRSEPT